MAVDPTHRASCLSRTEASMPPIPEPAPRTHRRSRWTGLRVVLIAITLSGLVWAVPAPTSATGAAAPTVLGPSVTFYGRGYGHGVGMSQYGARGRALDGQTATEILAHYFTGTTVGAVPLTTMIRVRVLREFAASATRPLVLYGRRTSWRIDGIDTVFPPDARVEVRPSVVATTTGTRVVWRVRVIATTGIRLLDAATRSFRMRGLTSSFITEVTSKRVTTNTYRGVMRVVLSAASTHANVANELTLERYLRGVVPAEMPASWPAEALKAQAIASRSYAARRLRPGLGWYDVPDGSTSQVYLGNRGERAAATAAISATAGVVLKSGSSIANTLFHSTGGGATEDNENVFNASSGAIIAGPVSYLRGSPDRRPDGSAYDDAAPFATWQTVTYSRAQLSAWFGADPRTNV